MGRRRDVELTDRVGDDGLAEPVEVPRWVRGVIVVDDWLERQLAKPAPRPLVWYERTVVDKVPTWAQPLVIMAPMLALTALSVFVPRLKDWLR